MTIGSNTPWRSGGPPYFARSRNRWSDSQSESYPARFGGPRVLDDVSTTAAATRPRPSSRTAGAPVRCAPAALYRGRSPAPPYPARGARVRAERVRGTRRARARRARRRVRRVAARPARRPRPPPLGVHPRRARRRRRRRRARWLARAVADARRSARRTPACTRASARSTSCRSSRSTATPPARRGRRGARRSPTWVADALARPGVPLRRRRPGGAHAARRPARRVRAARARPRARPRRTRRSARSRSGARPPLVAVNCELDVDDLALARAHRRARCASATAGCRACARSGCTLDVASGGRRCR